MSSAFASLPAAPFSESSRSELESFPGFPQQHTGHIKSWQSFAKGGRFESCYASGLPTPPETRAMTGTSINQHSSNDTVSQRYYPSKYSCQAYPSKGTEVRHYPNNGDGYTYNHAADQQQLWSASQEKEVNQAPKSIPNSVSVIASYLQIPPSINDSKGSLAEFAAEVGC